VIEAGQRSTYNTSEKQRSTYNTSEKQRSTYNTSEKQRSTYNKGNNKITELRTILQRESQNS
jgi:hypothetical protein